MNRIYCLLLLLCPYSITAQAPKTNSLSIGDKLPDLSFTQLQNGNSKTIKLSSIKQNLIILDFWATWCSNCIREFPKMHSLQKEFGTDLHILLVNNPGSGDTETKLNRFFAKYQANNKTQFSLPVVIADTVLAACFPHHSLPHTVWIHNNRVIAITAADELTKQNIQAVLSNQPTGMLLKKDRLNIDLTKPLLDLATLQNKELRSSATFTGYISGMGAKIGRYTDTSLGTQRRYFINQPLTELYALVATGIPPAHMQFTLPDSLDPTHTPGQDIPSSAKFAYELTMPLGTTPQQWQDRMLTDLNSQFKLQTEIKVMPTACYLLTRCLSAATQQNSKPPVCRNFKNISFWLNAANLQPYTQTAGNFIVNETGTASDSAVCLPDPAGHDISSLASALAQLGYSLLPATRNLNWLFVTPAPETTSAIFLPKN